MVGPATPPPKRRRDLRRASRGFVPVLGVVLLVGIVVLGMVLLVSTGGPAISDARDTARTSAAEHALGQFDAVASGVALGSEDDATGSIDFGTTGHNSGVRTTDDSWIRVDIVNATTGQTDAVVVNQTLGGVVYRNGDTTVAAEGGGVWRSDATGSTMVSRPEFHFNNNTLTLPIIAIDGAQSLGRTVDIQRAGAPTRAYPDPSRNLSNRVPEGKVAVTVHSEYYEAWGRFFERSTNGIVRYDHDAQTATVTFLAMPTESGLEPGIIATSGSGEVRLGGNSIYIDSYNSRQGTYSKTKGSQGTITAVNDVVATGDSNVEGDVRSGAVVDLSGTTDINGTVYWTDNYDPDGAAVSGGDVQIDGVATIEPIDGYVENTVAAARQSNNNSATTVISGNRITGSGTLNAGTYYLEDLVLESGDTLDIDTTDGDVTIAVEETVSIVGKGTQASKEARINVIGNGTVTVFVLGDDSVDLEVGKNAKVDVPKQRSTQFRVYGTQAFDAELTSDKSPGKILFEGVIYAPAGYAGTGSITIGQAKYFGAVVTGELTVKQGAEIHYDRALADERFPRAPTVSRIEFMHVAVHNVTVR